MNILDKLSLYEFQNADVERLWTQTGVLSVWEMGTGKTRFGLALDLKRREEMLHGVKAKTLIICPTAAVMNVWVAAYGTMTNLSVATLERKNRAGSWTTFLAKDADVLIMHWEAVRLIVGDLVKIKWFHIICDEVHRACDRKSQQTQSLKQIDAIFKTGLSGTPTDGRPDKLWSILNWLYPKRYRSYHRFTNQYCEMEFVPQGGYKKFIKPKNMPQLHEEIAPFYTMHYKRDKCCENHPEGVAKDMPERPQPVTYYVEMTPEQKRQYKEMRRDMISWLSELGDDEDEMSPMVAANVVSRLTRLQQIAAAPMGMINGEPRLVGPSPKVKTLMEIIEDNAEEKIVVFTQFAQLLDLVVAECISKKIPGSMIRGGQSDTDRAADIDFFVNGPGRILVSTISSGGEAIDGLQRVSSTCIFLDRMWNPGKNAQALARLDRFGQKAQVTVIDIITANSIDEERSGKLETKIGWVKSILEGTE